ncbi:MAG: thioredoxin family protein [Candidatus Rokubacteria bacterium]|nr:thioredoxin family protein [Candidatus Rokubacteria bacterium]
MTTRLARVPILSLVLALALLPQDLQAGVKGTPEGKPRVAVGDRAPLESEELREAHATGKAILLMFGNPWHCIYCEKVWLNIKELLPRFEKDIAFVLVAAQPVKFWEPPDENVRLARRYGIVGEPWVFLIDRSGVVRHIFVGFTERQRIEAELNKLPGRSATR